MAKNPGEALLPPALQNRLRLLEAADALMRVRFSGADSDSMAGGADADVMDPAASTDDRSRDEHA